MGLRCGDPAAAGGGKGSSLKTVERFPKTSAHLGGALQSSRERQRVHSGGPVEIVELGAEVVAGRSWVCCGMCVVSLGTQAEDRGMEYKRLLAGLNWMLLGKAKIWLEVLWE